jgi:hypothetical protein
MAVMNILPREITFARRITSKAAEKSWYNNYVFNSVQINKFCCVTELI